MSDPQISHQNASSFPKNGIFAEFVLSLAGSIHMHLGLSKNPFTGKVEKNFDQAQKTIDLLAVLEQKTQGNLTEEENKLLQVLLADLRLQFVDAKKQGESK